MTLQLRTIRRAQIRHLFLEHDARRDVTSTPFVAETYRSNSCSKFCLKHMTKRQLVTSNLRITASSTIAAIVVPAMVLAVEILVGVADKGRDGQALREK